MFYEVSQVQVDVAENNDIKKEDFNGKVGNKKQETERCISHAEDTLNESGQKLIDLSRENDSNNKYNV